MNQKDYRKHKAYIDVLRCYEKVLRDLPDGQARDIVKKRFDLLRQRQTARMRSKTYGNKYVLRDNFSNNGKDEL